MRPARLLVGLIVAGGGLAVGLNVVQQRSMDAKARALDARLQRDTAIFHARRFDRPVLRGTAAEGNAADAARAPFEALESLPAKPLEPLADLLRSGEPLPEDVVALVARHRVALDTLRAATQRAHAWNQVPFEDGANAKLPSFIPRLRAGKLLLAAASRAEPAECLRIAADAIRLGQDGGAGAGLLGLMVTAAQTDLALPVILRCARRAGAATRRDAARELALLAAHPLPFGEALESEALMGGGVFRGLTLDVPAFPTSSAALDAWRTRGLALDAWQHLADEPAQLRTLDARRFPESVALLRKAEQALASSGNPILAIAAPSRARYLERESTVQARLRAAVVLLESLADPALDPATLVARPELADPFSDKPLRWRREPALTLWSVGPDGKDDGATGDDVVTRP